ncbi:peroxiredoxin Dot5p [[Candida] jaroonii]|uniref:Peroxiredoxin Dot5p n=1 Tax=[Candida] jaroonii TaxID=467808 RepID=A0ACA9YCA5_9ASCO|nr:peroxiredoxin Dot5p [[Candida] jaroonii]
MVELRRSTRNKGKSKAEEPIDSKPVKKTKTTKMSEEVKPEIKEQEIEVGDSIPDLTLLDEDSNEINLVEAAKKTKYVVIFAYPKASTPGCTRQVCGFQAQLGDFKDLDVTIFGLSADLPTAQKKFVEKQGLEYHLLSDPKKELIGVLGAKKSPTGIKRSHWIFVDGKLKIKKIQISPEDSFNGALESIKEL